FNCSCIAGMWRTGRLASLCRIIAIQQHILFLKLCPAANSLSPAFTSPYSVLIWLCGVDVVVWVWMWLCGCGCGCVGVDVVVWVCVCGVDVVVWMCMWLCGVDVCV